MPNEAIGLSIRFKKVESIFYIALMRARAKGVLRLPPHQASNLTRTLIGAFLFHQNGKTRFYRRFYPGQHLAFKRTFTRRKNDFGRGGRIEQRNGMVLRRAKAFYRMATLHPAKCNLLCKQFGAIGIPESGAKCRRTQPDADCKRAILFGR